MHKIKIGLAAVVAVFAMSFTAVTNSSLVKGKMSAKFTTGCFVTKPIEATCTSNHFPTFSGTQSSNPVTISLVCVSSATGTTIANPTSSCTGFKTVCCYQVDALSPGNCNTPGCNAIGQVTKVYFNP